MEIQSEMRLRCLTVSQPWADYIRRRAKWVENRKWGVSSCGVLGIHAGLGSQYLSKSELQRWDTGCVVAIAKLDKCVLLSDVREAVNVGKGNELCPGTRRTWSEILLHTYTEGPVLWLLSDVVEIEPIPAKGKQGLWMAELKGVRRVA